MKLYLLQEVYEYDDVIELPNNVRQRNAENSILVRPFLKEYPVGI